MNRGDASLVGRKNGAHCILHSDLRKLITYLLPDKVRAAKN